jgi:hypothetical protein
MPGMTSSRKMRWKNERYFVSTIVYSSALGHEKSYKKVLHVTILICFLPIGNTGLGRSPHFMDSV